MNRDNVEDFPEPCIDCESNSSEKCNHCFDKTKDQMKDVPQPICPINMYFEGDEGECDTSKCDFDTKTRSCNEMCRINVKELQKEIDKIKPINLGTKKVDKPIVAQVAVAVGTPEDQDREAVRQDSAPKEMNSLTLLGQGRTKYPTCPEEAKLETFDNRWLGIYYTVELECPEFTSLCPKTGQPDFAKISIIYIPNKKLVESKSLKLYLFSFRSTGEFHENVINRIANDLNKLMQPYIIMVRGDFYSRGGISINPVVVLPNKASSDLRKRCLDVWE